MDTTRILSFAHPSQAELLLDALVRDHMRLGPRARNIQDRSELPSALQRVIIEAGRAGRHWSAWRDDDVVRCFTAEMIPARLNGQRCPALRVTSHDERGRTVGFQLWARLPDGEWKQFVLKAGGSQVPAAGGRPQH